MRESQLWRHLASIQKTKRDWHFFRIESSTINGIPDVNGCVNGVEIWLELKSGESKNYGLSKYQINWHIERLSCGGNVFILLFTPKLKSLKILRLVHQAFILRQEIKFELLGSCKFSEKNLERLLTDVIKWQNLT